MSSQDQIRAKRLAKLARSSNPATSSSGESLVTSTTSSPLVSLTKEVNIPETRPPVVSPTQKKVKHDTPVVSKEEQLQNWSNSVLEQILEVTLNPDHPNKSLSYLTSTHEESGDSSLSIENVDQSILELLTDIGLNTPDKVPLTYLKNCWIRARDRRRLIKNTDPLIKEKYELLDETIRLTSSYGAICFQAPEMFVNTIELRDTIEVLISNIYDLNDFLIQIIARTIENDALLEFLNILVPYLSQRLNLMDINSSDQQHVKIFTVLQILVSDKAAAVLFTEIDGWIEYEKIDKANEIETKSLLGPFYKISPLLDSVTSHNYYADQTKSQVHTTHESLQAEHRTWVDRLFYITDKLVRANEKTRNELLKFFAFVVNKNHLRRGEHANLKELASHSFMANIAMVLIKLCQPFLADPTYKKIDKIDIDYLAKNHALDFSDETRLNATIPESEEYYKSDAPKPNANFISDCFFLALTYLNYGVGGVLLEENRLKRDIKYYESELPKLEQMANNSLMNAMFKAHVTRLKNMINTAKAKKYGISMFFTHKNFQSEIFEFVVGASVFFMRLIDPKKEFPFKPLSIPLVEIGTEDLDDPDYLRQVAPKPFKYFPEMFVEGLINYTSYIVRYNYNPLMLEKTTKTPLFVQFSVTLLRCSELLGNPHLKGSIIEVLFSGSIEYQNGEEGFMMSIFKDDKMISDNLLISLLDFYVQCEKTGSSSQFYDKFNIRYNISFILEKLWTEKMYREQLKQQVSKNLSFFVRFVARILNDATYLLDESLRQLQEVHNCQVELDKRASGKPQTLEGTDEEIQKRLSQLENQARSLVRLSNKTTGLFNKFTKETPASFTIPEIVERLAGMLNYNLVALVGPKSRELKVKNPEQFEFDPSELLLNICRIYVNLSDQADFIDAVARDGRSFDPVYFQKLANILFKHKSFDANALFLEKLIKFSEEAALKKQQDEDEEMELGDVPDEFLDPLMYTLMKDPVILPTSKVSIDRSTIRAHLLNDPTDPFNRMPLRFEDVVPDVELKQKIEEYKNSKKLELRDPDGDSVIS